ncbi:MAG: hypothetical protein Q4B60_06465 [Erysipelotrichaceae bacterium]|nr:hypothetical protein [Erysipelotrichaceae bacterium]
MNCLTKMAKKRKRRRKLKVGNLLIVIAVFLLLIGMLVFGVKTLLNLLSPKTVVKPSENLVINELDYSESETLDIDLYSEKYMLIRLNDFKVLYEKGSKEKIYPASLHKVLTMDTVLSNVESVEETSFITSADYNRLIEDNASMAGLDGYKEYTIEELLYALILPSGGDAALALENYFTDKGLNLIDLMNKKCTDLGLVNTHSTNTTGLHNDNLYTCLNDYALIVIDTLQNATAKNVLKTFEYKLDDDTTLKSTLRTLMNVEEAKVYGGKTGFTGEAGENLMVLFNMNNRSYLLLLANADGNPYLGQNYHFNDAQNIIEYLYNKQVQ